MMSPHRIAVLALLFLYGVGFSGGCGDDEPSPSGADDPVVCTRTVNCPEPSTHSCVDGRCVEDPPCTYQVFTFDPGPMVYDRVSVAGSFNRWDPAGWKMSYVPRLGVWFTKQKLRNGRFAYKLVLNGATWIADPSNPQKEPDGLGGHQSVLERSCGSCGEEAELDWRDAVLYFVMTDRFYDSDGQAQPVIGANDGDAQYGPSGQYEGGDLRGVRAKLPYLAELGVTALWLSAPFENRDEPGDAIDPASDLHRYTAYHGYWPSPADIDYSGAQPQPRPAVESRIGTEEDLRELVQAAHAADTADGNGMRVLFDYVMNHVDIESGLYRAHPEWFARKQDGSFALCQPENLWEDPFWGTRCAFTPYLPPFDFSKEEARRWSIADALWWAKEMGIDGYRLDAIKHVPLSWLTELRAALDAEIPDPSGGRFFLVGETFTYDNRDLLRTFVDPDTMLDGQFDFPYKARLCEALFSKSMSLTELAAWMDDNDYFYGFDAIMTPWIGNHDVPRAIHFASGKIANCREGSHPGNGWTADFDQPQDSAPYERLALAFAVMMTNPGLPLIYYGDEVGLAGGGDPDNRRMMPWDDASLLGAQKTLRQKVAELGRIRAENRVLSRGYRRSLASDNDTWVYEMVGCGEEAGAVLVALNRADDTRQVEIPEGTYTDLVAGGEQTGGAKQLPPRSYVIWRKR